MSMVVIRPVEAPKRKDESDKSNFSFLYVSNGYLDFWIYWVILLCNICRNVVLIVSNSLDNDKFEKFGVNNTVSFQCLKLVLATETWEREVC
jgi:hypothetical protein